MMMMMMVMIIIIIMTLIKYIHWVALHLDMLQFTILTKRIYDDTF